MFSRRQNIGEKNHTLHIPTTKTGAFPSDTSRELPKDYPGFFDCFATNAYAFRNGEKTDLGAPAKGMNSETASITASGLIIGNCRLAT